LLALLMVGAPEVKTESSRFTITQDGKKIGSEEFSIKARKGGGYIAEATTKLNSEPNPIKARMELDDQLRPISYDYQRGKGVVRMKIGNPTSEYATGTDKKLTTVKFPFPDDGFIIDYPFNFFHQIQLLINRLGRKSGHLAIVVPQDMLLGAVTVTQKDDRTFEVELGAVTMQATIDPADGRLLRIAVPVEKVVVER
jgi:hypothetical protein